MKVFTLYVGTKKPGAGARILGTLRKRFDAFTLIEGQGHFKGDAEPMWFVKIATAEPHQVIQTAEEIRSALNQDGVGIEYGNCFYECTESDQASSLVARLTQEAG